MKYPILIFCFILTSNSLYAQQSGGERLDSTYFENITFDNEWQGWKKSFNLYDNNNWWSYVEEAYFDSQSSSWNPFSGITKTANEEGQLSKEVMQVWNQELSIWENYSQTEYIYDEEQYAEVTSKKWDTLSMNWVNDYKWTNTFNEEGLITNQTTYFTDENGSFYPFQQTNYQYEVDVFTLIQTTQMWEEDMNTWVNGEQITYEEDSEGRPIKNVRYVVNELNEWVADRKFEFSYDEEAMTTVRSISSYEEQLQDWLQYRNDYFSYNETNTLIEHYYEALNVESVFEFLFKHNYTLTDYENRLQEDTYQWDSDIEDWTITRHGYFYYSTVTKTVANESIIPTKLKGLSKLYTNNTVTKLNGLAPNQDWQLQLIDMNGRIAAQKNYQSGEALQFSNLKEGHYILRVIGNEDNYIGQWIILD